MEQVKKEISLKMARWLRLESLSPDASEREKERHYQKFVRILSHKLMWQVLIMLPFCALFLWIGRATIKHSKADEHKHEGEKQAVAVKKNQFWTCSMHPNVRLPQKDKCPICFMDLVLVEAGGDQLSLDYRARRLASIEVDKALYRKVQYSVHMVGKVDYDETRVINLTLWTPGRSRINRMFVNFTGAIVQKGEPLVEVYSEDMISAQGEYISAYRSWKSAAKDHSAEIIRDNLKAARRKLLDLGMTKAQVKKLEQTGIPNQMLTIFSPVSGTVIAKLTNEGEWHNRGMSLYRIADLSKVWVRLDVYENEIKLIRYAQPVEFEAEAYPGKKDFKGRIAFIDPFLDEKTRTVKIRVNADNEEGLLKPGMFVRAQVKGIMAENGEAWEPTLAGKWVCPIHPQVIRKEPGKCGIKFGLEKDIPCPRWLVLASPSLKHVMRTRVLTIPATAPLLTGKRAIVYVERIKRKRNDMLREVGTKFLYEQREVLLGSKVGNYYIVLSGLEEGEIVVSKGTFKIDSALQIKAKPSMMLPAPVADKENEKKDKIPPYALAQAKYHQQLEPLILDYLELIDDLANSREDRLEKLVKKIRKTIEEIKRDPIELDKNGTKKLAKILQKMDESLEKIVSYDTMSVRAGILVFSDHLTEYLENFGHKLSNTLYKMDCPMVKKEDGAFWWQRDPVLKNPYMKVEMRQCGFVRKKLLPLKGEEKGHLAQEKFALVELGNHYHQNMTKFLAVYLEIGDILTQDNTADILNKRDAMLTILTEMYQNIDREKHRKAVSRLLLLKQALIEMHGDDLKKIRRDYFTISQELIRLIKGYGHSLESPLYIMHCPMYRNDMGGSWLQKMKQPLRNPYFGSEMLRCGDFVETIEPNKKP